MGEVKHKLLTATVGSDSVTLESINVVPCVELASYQNKTPSQELELNQSKDIPNKIWSHTSTGIDTSLQECEVKEDWVTPEILFSKDSDCYIVGNKFTKLIEDESTHSKWEEFRKMAKSESANEECSQLLRRMELQDSDEEEEYMLEDEVSEDNVEAETNHFEETNVKKKQKRQMQWGPVQRVPRQRRYPEDGKTVMQRACELKEYKNLCKGTKPSLSIALESHKTFIEKSNCVDISLGSDIEMIVNNVEHIINKDLASRVEFMEKNPEINLPSNLNVDLSLDDFPILVGNSNLNLSPPLKENENKGNDSWAKITCKGLQPPNLNNDCNDRSNLEC